MATKIIEQYIEPLEGFTEAEEESLFMEEEFETLAEFHEEENLEDIEYEAVAEDMEAYFYEAEAETYTPDVNQRMLRVMTVITKHVVNKINYNPRARAKLQAACRQGHQAIAQLLLPSIKRRFPNFLQWLPAIYLPAVVRVLYNPICKKCGVQNTGLGMGGNTVRKTIKFTGV